MPLDKQEEARAPYHPMKLTDFTRYADAQRHFASARLWELFDGDRERLNIAHECIDRHVDGEKTAVIVVRADGDDEILSYRQISEDSARFAHWLRAKGVAAGDRVAIKLEPSRGFYAAVFGAMKAGAIAVPLFTLFGPDGVKLRVEDCKPKLLIETDGFLAELGTFPATFEPDTRADDLAIFQYTSGTTRELPEAVKHSHRAIVTVMVAALYGTGLRPGDRFICPSSPAWGHGLWHGTLAPLAMGMTIGCYAGKFEAARLLQALEQHRFTNISAAATHYRMMRVSGAAAKHRYALAKTSFTGEPIDSETAAFCEATFGPPMCSMYGTTEIGVILVSYPGAPDFVVKPGSLGKPIPGGRVEVQDAEGKPCPPGVTGEMKVWRRDRWIATKDLGRTDEDGYFFHGGRTDDVIISAGWTMSALEIEQALLAHPDVREAAVIGVPDELRGQIPKACIVAPGKTAAFAQALQEFVKDRLSKHEYPRAIEIVDELPKTPAGKIDRKTLRERVR